MLNREAAKITLASQGLDPDSYVIGPCGVIAMPKPAPDPVPPLIITTPAYTPVPSVPITRVRDDADDSDDKDECDAEWDEAFEDCAENQGKDQHRNRTPAHMSLHQCAKGLVSQRCGGNRVEW